MGAFATGLASHQLCSLMPHTYSRRRVVAQQSCVALHSGNWMPRQQRLPYARTHRCNRKRVRSCPAPALAHAVIPEAKYAASHEWAKVEGNTAISDHAQSVLGDVVYVELPELGATVTKGETFGVVESVKVGAAGACTRTTGTAGGGSGEAVCPLGACLFLQQVLLGLSTVIQGAGAPAERRTLHHVAASRPLRGHAFLQGRSRSPGGLRPLCWIWYQHSKPLHAWSAAGSHPAPPRCLLLPP